jgi:hypothetical protein
MATPIMWFFTPDCDNIKVVKRDLEKPMREYLKCEMIDSISISPIDTDNEQYAIFFDDMGLYNPAPINRCADKYIRKLTKNTNWGSATLTGWFAICKYVYDEDGEETQVDMDMTPKQFVQYCRKITS